MDEGLVADDAITESENAIVDMAMAISYEDIPSEVIAMAKLCILDVITVMLRGAAEPVTRIVAAETLDGGAPGRCAVVGAGRISAPATAALVNGTAAHALDYDDWAPASGVHPSAPLFAAVLAAGEAVRASGRDLLTAFVAGYETQELIGRLAAPAHYARGHHSTGTIGTFGATVAAGRVMGLDRDQMRTALATAATQAAGLKSMFGSMGKPFHAGRAASNGVFSARLAARGFTAGPGALTGPQGFLDVHASGLDNWSPELALRPPWELLDVKFKRHASCFGTHAAVDAALAIRERAGRRPMDIAGITVRVSPGLRGVCVIPEPSSALEAKFSVAFTTALALQNGSVDETVFTAETVARADLQALTRSVTLEWDPSMSKIATAVTVHTADGGREEAFVDLGRRAWVDHPDELAPQLRQKSSQLLTGVRGMPTSAAVIALVETLEGIDDVWSLGELISSAQIR